MTKPDFSGPLTASCRMRVPFHDVDPAKVVWHGRYFKYFEEVRCRLLDKIEYSYDAMMDSGLVWPIVDTNVRFVRPLRFDQEFVVTAVLSEWELRIVIDYKIESLDGEELTRGRTVQVPLDIDTLELQFGTPEELATKMAKFLADNSD